MEDNIELRKHSKYFFLASFVGVIILAIVLIWPFITALLGSVILAYIFYPIYKKILNLIKSKELSALIMSFIVILILAVPLIFAANALLNEANQFFLAVRTVDVSKIDKTYFDKYFGENVDLASYTKDLLSKLSIRVLQAGESLILSLPQKILALFVMFFIMYYLFKEGPYLLELIKSELPLKEHYKKNIAMKFNNTIYAVIYGVLITAFVQGVVGIIGFYVFNIKSPLLLGFILMLTAMIPVGGTALIWLPLSVYKFAIGEKFNAVGLFLYGLLIISTIDNIIKPKLIGGKGKIHPALVLLGVLGGLKMFGLIGIIIGPLALALLVVFVELYKSEKSQEPYSKL